MLRKPATASYTASTRLTGPPRGSRGLSEYSGSSAGAAARYHSCGPGPKADYWMMVTVVPAGTVTADECGPKKHSVLGGYSAEKA